MDVCFHPDEPQRAQWGFADPTVSADGLNWVPCKAVAKGKGFAFDLPVGAEGRRVLWKRTHDEVGPCLSLSFLGFFFGLLFLSWESACSNTIQELASWNFSTMDWKLVDSRTNEVLAVYLGKIGKGGKLNWHGDVGGLEGEAIVAASIVAFVSLGVKIGSANTSNSASSSRLGSSVGSRGH